MSVLGVSVASNATSQSISSGSLVFNPVLTLESPEATIRSTPTADTSAKFSDTTSTGTARAKTTISPLGGGADGEEGFAPGVRLGSASQSRTLVGDLVPRGLAGGLSSPSGLLLLAGLGVAAFFLAKRFL